MEEKIKNMWGYYPRPAVAFAVIMAILIQAFLLYYVFTGGGGNLLVIILVTLLDIVLGTYLVIYLWLHGKHKKK